MCPGVKGSEILCLQPLEVLHFIYVSLISLFNPLVLYSSGRHIVSGPSVKAPPEGSLKLSVTQTQIDSLALFVLLTFLNKTDIYLNLYF